MSLLVHGINPRVQAGSVGSDLQGCWVQLKGESGRRAGTLLPKQRWWCKGHWLTISPCFGGGGGGGVAGRSCLQSVCLWPINFQSSAPKVANVVLKAKSSQILLWVKSCWSPWIEPELWRVEGGMGALPSDC